jgi:protein-S-isoprenylcysteine O-methyltransferase Ste14
MARKKFKTWLTKFIPEPMERSTFCLFTSLVLITIFIFWQPMGGVLWSIDNGVLKGILLAIFVLGWGLVLASTFVINHFDLFGLRQVWLYFRKKPYTQLEFRISSLYKIVRHPIYLGMFLALWAAPLMSISRLVFAVLLTGYLFIGIYFEEKDLIKAFGSKYMEYKERVPKLFPKILPRKSKKPVYESIIKRPSVN